MADARARLKKFQQKSGLKVTGKYDSQTRRNLKLARKGRPLQTAKAKTSRRKARADAVANDPAALTQPLTPKLLDEEIASQTRSRFGPQEQQIHDQERVSDEQQRRVGTWFDDYMAKVRQAGQQTQAGYQQAGRQIEGLADRDQASSASPEAQQALTARQALVRSGAGLNSTLAANANAQSADRERVAALTKVQAHQGESTRRRGLADQLKALTTEKGDFATKLRQDARVSERNNLIANATLGLNQQKAGAEAKDEAARRKLNQQLATSLIGDRKADNRRLSKKDRAAESKDAYQRRTQTGPYKVPAAKGGKGSTRKPLTGEQKADRRKITQAKGQFEGPYKKNYRKYYNEGRANNIDEAVLHAGYELSRQGYIGPHTAKALRALGYTIDPSWRKKPPSSVGSRSRPN